MLFHSVQVHYLDDRASFKNNFPIPIVIEMMQNNVLRIKTILSDDKYILLNGLRNRQSGAHFLNPDFRAVKITCNYYLFTSDRFIFSVPPCSLDVLKVHS